MTDIADLVAPRLTDDELDALLLEHRSDCGCIPMCDDATCSYCDHLWPCEPWRLATEVKDLRAVRDAAREWRRMNTGLHTAGGQTIVLKRSAQDGLLAALARYEEGGR